ncbi:MULTISPECIES: molybdopterin-containing oxidoreductase family protein [Spongiibacter]|uniref:molybdopterin-containing oxidoreductase family protein n=1 Tax=Spongiibacter TaxID=630749 RepID=UPI000C40D7EE|nr:MULTISPECIES: molybdopterin-dependent oxidoreductase [Spongiibacter]MAY38033.1 formate dehydrogenase [Spongiibacter sp.]MBI58460.1 formate dehydrogenase [Spongiibacter sp.]|tara:strand:- start:82453 stop:84624 length:2172 start_codon:yes stop_codon:yes gene_type:complete
MKTCHTVCGICEQGCGLTVTTDNNRVLKVEPDKDNPYSWRDYCIKGAKSHLSLRHPDRITTPMKRVGDRYVAASYDEAIADIATRFNRLIDEHGPNAIGSYTGNPNGFNFGSALFHTMLLDAIGTESRFWVGSVDQNALHVASDAMYGNAWVSLQADIDHCDYFLLIGTNPQISTMCWIGYSPDGWKRVLARKAAGAELVVVDPRRTECAAKASRHIAPLPESDWALVLAMIKLILENGWRNPQHADLLEGLDTVRAIAATADLNQLSACCDVPLSEIETLARDFARAPSAMAIARTGVSQGRNGVLALWLVQVLNYITGRVETEGGLYYVSGVLDLLDVGDTLFPHSDAISRVRGNKNVAGAHSLAELPDEITTPGPGQIRALIINSGNPVVSGPDGNKLDAALAQLDCLVVIDQFQRESHRHADWLIPGDHFLERTEINPLIQALSPSPRAQLSRAAVSPPTGMRYEWEFLRDLTLAMNKPLIPGKRWLNPLIAASTRLAAWSGKPQLTLNPMLMARMLIRDNPQLRWRDIVEAPHGIGDPAQRPEFGRLFGKLREQNRRVDLAPATFVDVLQQRLTESTARDPSQPFQLISRRRMKMMNSWSIETSMDGMHSREMTGSTVEINRQQGETLHLFDGQKVTLRSASGSIEAQLKLSDEVRSGVAVMEHGWGYRTFNPGRGSSRHHGGVNRNLLVSNADVDPLSRVPRLNGTPVSIEPVAVSP